jgi:exosortase
VTVAARRLGVSLLALLVVAAYAPTFPWLVTRWLHPDRFFSHGPLVPAASAFLLWRRRRELAGAAGEGDWRGLLAVAPALALLVMATAVRLDSPALGSLLLLLPGLVLLLAGPRATRIALFPLLFLVFAIPWPMELLVDVVQTLKLVVVGASVAVVNLFGAGIRPQGSWLLLPDGDRLLVDDECSGLNSAIALLALGVLMAGTARDLSTPRRLLLAGFALPIALAANLLRVVLLAAIGRARGSAGVAAWHTPTNLGVYAAAIVAYVLLERALRRRPDPYEPPLPGAALPGTAP